MDTHAAISARHRGASLLVLVLFLVNSAAIWGQAGWALDHIVPTGWDRWAGLILALGFAAALELIGVFLAMMADQAEADGQPSGGIRLGSYAQGLVSGLLNLSHWGWWTAAAAAFGLLSSISPFLWGIFSRVRRGRPVAPSRRFWHPVRSVQLIRFMAWEGIAREIDAIHAMTPRSVLASANTPPVRPPLRVFAGPHSIPPQPEPEVHPVPVPQPSPPERVRPAKPAEPQPERMPQGVHRSPEGVWLRGPDLKANAVTRVLASMSPELPRGMTNADLAAQYTPPLSKRTAEEFGAEARKAPARVNGRVPDVAIP